MGIWVELGIFGLALAFGIWQIRDVAKERAKREAAQAGERERSSPTRADQSGRDGSDH